MPTEIEIKLAEINLVRNPVIGLPDGKEDVCPDGIGRFQHYQTGESIYWHPDTGAQLIYGLIKAKWAQLGWEKSPLGYPTTDEVDAGSGGGNRYNNFQNGIIIWKGGASEAFAVYGAIYGKWSEQGYDVGKLGLPLTDESGMPGGSRRYNYFEGGAIFWTSITGATIVEGAKQDDKKVAFVLSGGGSHGDFQLGALAALYEAGIKPNILCGTSVGALNAFMLAHGESGIDELKKIWLGLFNNDHMWNLDNWWGEVDKDLREPVVSALRGEKSSLDTFIGASAKFGALSSLGGSILFGPFGALLAFIGIFAASAYDKIKHFADLITGKARALLNLDPVKTLFNKRTNLNLINEWIAIGNQLRFATVALGSGELCYVTETGDLIDREQKKVLKYGISLIDGAMASSAIGSIFPPVQFADDSWVDGGHRENIPLKAALELGATEVYVIVSGPVSTNSTVNYSEEGFIGSKDSYKNLDGDTITPYDFNNKFLVDIALRAILDITGDENAAADIYSLISTSKINIHLIKPTYPTHDIVTIDPNLIRVNYDYGYRVASDVLENLSNDLLNISDQIALKQGRLSRLKRRAFKNANTPWASESDTLRSNIDDLINQRASTGAKIKGPEVQNIYPAGDFMQCGDVLLHGQSIISGNGQYQLIFQTDGQLILFDNKGAGGAIPVWVPWTNPGHGDTGGVVFQADGNLVIYNSSFKNILWSSNKFFAVENQMKHENVLKVVSDGNIVIYEQKDIFGLTILWQSKVPTAVTGSISVDNRTNFNVTVSFHNVGDDPKSIFTTVGMPTGIAAARVITPFSMPLGYTQIQVTINGSNTRTYSSGETYLWDKEERVHIFNETDMPVIIRFYNPGEILTFLSVPIVGVADTTHDLPPHSDWWWTMPNDLTSVKYTFANRITEAKIIFRGEEARYRKTSTVLISNQSSRIVRFLFFKWDDPEGLVYEPFPFVGDKTLAPNSEQTFIAPVDVTDKVSVRVNVNNAIIDDRRTAQKVIINLGDTLVYHDDNSVTTG